MSARGSSSAPPRRVPVPTNNEQYITVPQTPYSPPRSRPSPSSPLRGARPMAPNHTRNMSSTSNVASLPRSNRNITAQEVQSHSIGAGFGPYAHQATPSQMPPPRLPSVREHHRGQSSVSVLSDKPLAHKGAYTTTAAPAATTEILWDQKDELDILHDPDPVRDALLDHECDPFSGRGWLNVTAILLICFGLITLFAGYPIISWAGKYSNTLRNGGYNLGGINGSGQVPVLPNLPSLIDSTTPKSAYTRTGYDKKKYNLVFSDEFNTDGRTFWPGDDPWWEAVDLHYWATGDLEWYAPDAITTKDGNLVITMLEQVTHDLNFQSGMLQSWNKLCFSSGYVEVNISLPGAHNTAGFWPGAWTMGNLGRAGYGATTEGMWPYSYDSCDIGTYPAQQNKDGTPTPETTLGDPGATFSSLPGQKVSACTCPGSDHPGPNVNRGRGVPEIDIIEAQIEPTTWQGEASQSFQVAPFNAHYQFDNSTTTMYNTTASHYNPYKGGPYQQAVSAVSDLPNTSYGGTGYSTYGFELWGNRDDRANTYITWYIDGVETWTATAAAVGADTVSGISSRIISEEPMYIILNLGMAPSFQKQDFANLKFPAHMLIDYVRVYQRSGSENIGCNPKQYPTTDYINDHIGAYTNPNFTTWAQASYEFPRNSRYDGC